MLALEDKTMTITNDNFRGLSQLSEEFGFRELSTKLSQFQNSDDFDEYVVAVSEFKESLRQRGIEIEILRERVAQFEPWATKMAPALSRDSILIDSLIIDCFRGKKIDPLIVSDFPSIFEEFKDQRFLLLWRGSRDGFFARDFHKRCDGHANTLTMILDTKWNIFGGFTPIEWESRKWNRKFGDENNCWKCDPSLKSFIFTLKNPHNFPARRFALKPEAKEKAIECDANWGPCFYDIDVSDNCNSNTLNSAEMFGTTYDNDTGLDNETFLTGSSEFEVKEIEVFEIIP
jgi:phosphopantetheinyl transferase (holo-ACP synthase)